MTAEHVHVHADTDPARFLAATVEVDRGESPFGWSDPAWPAEEAGR
ncbi:hypothetical protein [Actinacidiphila acidipaludis]|uniref:GNAT family N-acetyltransferase n=1 Tax=Actinacidiphila acidipaludis TaxID=2873382 RepID=A0ABS7Q0U9_9ACTN|nr:hypothetical protein [Streptomyces acidipaludis]MBY8876060.1 hypothetical protein [Streptomyces acidipaludis]